MGILDRVETLDSIADDFFNICIYGEPGSGKTVLACSFPNVLLIDVDRRGHISLRNHPALKNVRVFRPETYQDVYDLFAELRKGRLPEYETIVLDTISEFNKNSLTEALRKELVKPNTKRQRFDYWMNDYKPNTEITRELIIEMRDLKRNTIVVAHELREVDKDTDAVSITPALPPKALESLWSLTDLIGYLSIKTSNDGREQRKIRFKRSGTIYAKTRYKVEKPELENPTAELLLKITKHEKELENAN